MSEIKEFKDIKEFSTGNKVRDLIIKEINPTIDKMQTQFGKVREEINDFKDKYQVVLKFDDQKQTILKNVKDITGNIYEFRQKLIELKNEGDINHTKSTAGISTLRTVVETIERNFKRKEENLQSYDRKIDQMMDTISKQQTYISDRLTIFQEKFKKISRETYQMTKDVKRDFNNSLQVNQGIKKQLFSKIQRTQQQGTLLQLFVAQREENTKKMLAFQQNAKDYAKIRDLQQFKNVQDVYLQQHHRQVESLINGVIPLQTRNNLKIMNIKFAQIEQLKLKSNKIQDLKLQMKSISQNIKSIQSNREQQFSKLRIQTDQMEEKIIEVIDKRLQTIEDILQQKGTQTEQTFDQRIQKLKESLVQMLEQKLQIQNHKINTIQKNHPVIQPLTLSQIQTKKQVQKVSKQKIGDQMNKIKGIAEGLQQKLNLFSNKIVVCKSDIQIFSEKTRKELKKIAKLKIQNDNNMEYVGKILSQLMEAITVLTSLEVNKDKIRENKFVTYQDGIVLEVSNNISDKQIIYRRKTLKTSQLKESLLYSLLSSTDQIISSQPQLKWDYHKPSEFFKIMKDQVQLRQHPTNTQTLHLFSNKKVPIKIQQEDSLLSAKIDYEDSNRQSYTQRSKVTITNSKTLIPLERTISEVQKLYRIKKSQDSSGKRSNAQRNCFTASRSHRKTKLTYL